MDHPPELTALGPLTILGDHWEMKLGISDMPVWQELFGWRAASSTTYQEAVGLSHQECISEVNGIEPRQG